MASQGTSNPLKHKMYSRAQWELLKPLIRALYLQEAWTYKMIAKYLRDNHDFEPTENQFKKKILEWKFRKYTTGAERREIAESLYSDDPIIVRGQVVDKAKLKRWEKQGHSTSSIIHVGSHEPCKTIPRIPSDERSTIAAFEEPMQNFSQLCEDETNTFIDVDILYDEPQNILIKIMLSSLDDCKDVSETLDDAVSQDKAVRSLEGNRGSPPYNAHFTKQKIYQNQNGYFRSWKIGGFLDRLHAFPRAMRIVAGTRLRFLTMPAESVARIMPECSRKFQRLSTRTPEEIIGLIDNMWGIADTYYRNGHLRQAEIWYRRIVTAKQKSLHYDPLGTLKACLRVVDSLYSQGRYLDASNVHRDFNLQIQRVLPAHHCLVVKSRQMWADILAFIYSRGTEPATSRRENLHICLSALGMRHEYTFEALVDLGVHLNSVGFYIECEAIFRAGLDIIYDDEAEHGHNWTLEARFAWRLMLELARVLRSQRKFCEAQKILENARSRYKQFAKVGNHTWFAFYYEMAALKWNTGDLAVSEKFLLPIFQQPRWTSSIPYWIKGNSTWLMAHVLEDSGRIEEAATWYEKLFHISIERHGIQSKQAISNCRDWGFCYAQLGFFGKAISVFEKVIQDIEFGQGRGIESSDQCLQRLRGYIARVMEMQKEKEAPEVDEMSHGQYGNEDEEMPDNEDIIEDIDLYGPESKLRLVRSDEAAEISL